MKEAKMELIAVVSTFPSKEEAEKVGKSLVEERLAACAQVGGAIESFNWWEGKVESSREWPLTVKTLKEKYREVEKRIKELHPYEVPQIVAFPVTCALEEYLTWVKEEVK